MRIRSGNINVFNIKINLIFLLIVICIYVLGYIQQFLVVFISMILHELGHIFCAILMGKKVELIKILPVGVNAFLSDNNFYNKEHKTMRNIIIYLGGPITNLILIFVSLLVSDYNYTLWNLVIYVNAYVAVFNLIPILPLDGGNIVKELLDIKVGKILSFKYMVKFSRVVLTMFIVFGSIRLVNNIDNIGLILVWIYLFFSLNNQGMEVELMSIKDIMYRRARFLKKGIYPMRDLVVIKSVRLLEVLKNLDFDRFHIIYVLDEKFKVIKVLTEQEVIDGMTDKDSELSFEEFIERI